MSTVRVRVGLVGGGLIAQVAHLPALAGLGDRFAIAAICDPRRSVSVELARRHRAVAFADWREMLDAGGLDAVLVCSPNATHAPIALAALAAGLHVFVEKPLCIDPADGDRIVAAQAVTGLVVQVGYMKQFDPAVAALRERVADRRAQLRLIDVVTHDPWLVREPFVAVGDLIDGVLDEARAAAGAAAAEAQVRSAIGAGSRARARAYVDTFLSCLIHDVNLVNGVLDVLGDDPRPRPVSAGAWAHGQAGSVTQELRDGTLWHTSWLLLPRATSFRERVELWFDDGVESIVFPSPYDHAQPTVHTTSAGRVQRFGPPSESYRAELCHFHACITSDAAQCSTASDGARDVAQLRDLFLLTADPAEVPA